MLASLQGSAPEGWPEDVEVAVRRSPNLKSAVAWCRERQPDLILVYGTSILKGPMIRLPRLGVLNAHSSILPAYRGVFSEFWQTLHGRLKTAGVTIHSIDEGVDTGDLLVQQRTHCESGIDPYRLRCRNVLTTLEAYPKAALQVLSGTAEHRRQRPSNQPTYRARDLTFAKRLELWRRLGKL
jgi:methionyl-tRNA formyltransferase